MAERTQVFARLAEIWPAMAGMAIPTLTVIGIVVGLVADGVGMDPLMEVVLLGVLLLVSATDIGMARFVILPGQARSGQVPRETMVTTGYALIIAIPIYGLVAAVFLGNPLVPLLFFVLALIGYYAVRSFFEEEAHSLRR